MHWFLLGQALTVGRPGTYSEMRWDKVGQSGFLWQIRASKV